MKASRKLLAAAVLAALSAPAFAEVELDVIGGSEITFEGLIQADGYWYNSDVANLGVTAGASIGDGKDSDFAMRRAELVLKGKGPGMLNWVLGYDARADKFLDVNVQYKFDGFSFIRVGQYKQPNSFEELSSTKNNDFIAKAMTTNLQGVARRMGLAAGTGSDNWTVTGSVFTREMTRNLGEGNGWGARGTWAPILDTGSICTSACPTWTTTPRTRAPPRAAPRSTATDARASACARMPTSPAPAWSTPASSPMPTASEPRPGRRLGARPDQGAERIHEDRREPRPARRLRLRELVRVRRVEHHRRDLGLQGRRAPPPAAERSAGGMWQVGMRYDHVDLNDGDFTAPRRPPACSAARRATGPSA
jgi:phosphate-selective porin OprO/OprP